MPTKNIRNFCIIAHIDHGKSTLADRMLELTNTVSTRDMKEQILDKMDLERERGITIKLQPARMKYLTSQTNADYTPTHADKPIAYDPLYATKNIHYHQGQNPLLSDQVEYQLNLIDTPGHVDFGYEVSRSLAAVEGAILLVDATKGIQAQTLANLYQAIDQNLDIIPVINKIDLPNAQIEKTKMEIVKLLGVKDDEILEISAKTGQGVDNLFQEIVKKIRPPKINDSNPLRALIFDSIYDEYRGVVAYVRIVDGSINNQDTIRLMTTNQSDKAIEVGYFKPQYTKQKSLNSGEIGYIVTGFKDVSHCKVGDTITQARLKTSDLSHDSHLTSSDSQTQSHIQPLPGYKQVKPMVFAQVYTQDGEINKLREALEKLSINDSSLSFKPTNSKVLGLGFECGFLGLLHLEITTERLKREYDLNIIVTTPKVNYKITQENSKIVYEEPWAKLEIVTSQNCIGPIMELTSSSRAKYISTEYIGDRVVLNFEAPLANIIIDFYDRLKSISSGYASLNYEFTEYRKEDLVKLDIIISGEKYDALSQIVHRSRVLSKAKNIVKKLKETLPKQMFQISIQAAVGGKIVARENLSALKKDVAGYLYGGDISRKKKLWAKQAKGKKRMEKMGKVDIPTDIYIKLIR
jgi:GTP-binding protein LepA